MGFFDPSRFREQNDSVLLEYEELGSERAAGLAAYCKETAVRTLAIRWSRLAPNDVGSLLRAPLPALTGLDLSHNELGDEGVREIARASLSSLIELNLARTGMTSAGLMALGASPLRATLEWLCLGYNPDLGPEGFGALSSFVRLRELHLRALPLTAGAIARLVDTGIAERLMALDLQEVGLDESSLSPLIGHLGAMRRLFLTDNDLPDEAMAEFLSSFTTAQLRELALDGNELGPATAAVLSGSSAFANLQELTVDDEQLTEVNVRTLSGSSSLPRRICLALEARSREYWGWS